MDDAEPTVPPAAPQSRPAGRTAPPTSRAVAMFAIVFVVIGLIAAGAWFIGGSATPEPRSCRAEGVVDAETGITYSRDIDHDCKLVDAAGNERPDR